MHIHECPTNAAKEGLPAAVVPEHRVMHAWPEDGPLAWHHANLGELVSFLQAEARSGRFTPCSGLPWEFPKGS